MKKILCIFYLIAFVFLSASAQNTCNVNLTYNSTSIGGTSVSFSGNTSTSTFGYYTWNFGDGTTASGQNVNHTFPSAGNFPVCLTFFQSQPNFPYDSCIAVYCDSITIQQPTCTFSTSFTSTSLGGNTVNFSGNTSASSTGYYTWDFGDGTTSSGQNTNHTFSSSGSYIVCLKFIQTDPNYRQQLCEAVYCDSITIAKPDCAISTSFTSTSLGGRSVSFSGNALPDSYGYYTWEFGDGTSASGQYTDHTFPASGSYIVCLKFRKTQPQNIYDSCVAVYCDSITISKPDCAISTSFTSTSLGENSVSFSGNISTFSPGYYTWDFGDGTTSSGQNTSHTYSTSGSYIVCLKFIQTDPNYRYQLCEAVYCDSITITKPDCAISTSFTSTSLGGRSVSFSGNAFPDSYGYYTWEFGDGASASGQYIDHTFPASGSYIVCLKFRKTQPQNIYDSCVAVYCDSITIAKPACNISTSFTSASLGGRSVSFLGNALPDSYGYYTWEFGDGTTASGQNINHTFPTSGTYTVCLKFRKTQPQNIYDSCVAVYCDSITIAKPACNISTSFTSASLGGRSVSFSGNGLPGSFGHYIWNFGDGTTEYGQNVEHSFPTSGNYPVCLTFLQAQPNFPYDSCVAVFCDSIKVKTKNNKPNGNNRPTISIYPMPAFDRINIQITDEDSKVISIVIFNNFGEVVKKETIINENYIDINDLTPGTYILRANSAKKVYMKQFIKN